MTVGSLDRGQRRGKARRRIDSGKVAMCTIAAALTPYYLLRAYSSLTTQPRNAVGAVTEVLIAAYYAVIAIAYATRGDATARESRWSPRIAAVVATWLPLAAPFVAGRRHATGLLAAANAVLLFGLCWSIWSLVTLGRSLSVVPQVRTLVTRGPYRLVRHPLYFGELTMLFGVCLGEGVTAAVALWLAVIGLQLYRMRHEEQLLTASIPEYASYKATTRRLVPRLY